MNWCSNFKMIIRTLAYLFLMALGNICLANQNQDDWQTYIDGSVGKNNYYLYDQVMSSSFPKKSNYRALDLGSGAGDVDFKLAALGWDVTSVDTSRRAGEIISKRIKYINGKFNFQLSDFENAALSGEYDLVLSFFALPFGDKNNLPNLVRTISQHMRSDALFAVTFFGNEHSFVKNGQAYGISQDELSSLLTSSGFEIRYLLNRHYKQAGGNGLPVNWDVFDVIARKI